MVESLLTFRPSSTVKSQMPITNCFLLSEVRDESWHNEKLALKYNLSALTIESLDRIKEYNLSDVAVQVGVNDGDDNELLTLNIIKICLGSAYEYQTNTELKIGRTPVSKLKECYISTNSNRGDVMVLYEGSHVLYTEVHSSSKYVCTVTKTVYLLMECLRMLKAFGVMQPKMDAFVFPRREYSRCVVKLSMQYSPDSVRFQYSFRCLQIHEISSALTVAVQSNRAACQNLTAVAELDYILWLTTEERRKWGTDLHNVTSDFGILLMNDDVCIKRPIFTQSFNMLFFTAELRTYGKSLKHISTYSVAVPRVFIKYDKIRHEPLSYSEGRQCSRELVIKVNKAIQCIHTAGYMHRDVRLANICFDASFDPILTGFDMSTIYMHNEVDIDMEKFANELIKCFDNSQAARGDLFIQNYAKGKYYKNLLETSIINSGVSTLQSVIIDRHVS